MDHYCIPLVDYLTQMAFRCLKKPDVFGANMLKYV